MYPYLLYYILNSYTISFTLWLYGRLPVKVFKKTLNDRQSHILGKFHKIERF